MAREITLQNMRTIMRNLILMSKGKTVDKSVHKCASLIGHNCARALFGQNWSNTLRDLSFKFHHNFTIYAGCLEKQCSFLFIQRMRRAAQLLAFYNRLYGEKLVDQMGGNFFRRMQHRPLAVLLGAAFFSWDEHKIKDEELNRYVYDMEHIQDLVKRTMSTNPAPTANDWEKVIDKPNLIVWRKPLDFNPNLFQYKVYGRFDDVPARAFFNTQVDFDFWKSWDKLSEDIKIVDRHEASGSEIVHWTVKFPYPMYMRDYVYVRRYKVDPENKVIVLYNRTVSHPSCPEQKDIVRVNDYESALVIHPLKDFDENGCQYVLTYFDDPQTTFPKMCYNWMASTGVPDFVEKMHKAAKLMHERTQKGYRPVIYENRNQNNHAQIPVSQYL